MRKIFILISFSLWNSLTMAQNLVKNASFEQHHIKTSLISNYTAQSNGVDSWISQGWNITLCDANYKRNSAESMYMDCKNISIKEGETTMKMTFSHCFAPNDRSSQGCASYMATTMNESLKIGKFYEVSFWVYIPTTTVADTLADMHIGFKFMRGLTVKKNGEMFYFATGYAPKIKRDAWVELKWVVRPLCEMQDLMIGIFKDNDWHLKNSEHWKGVIPGAIGYDAWAKGYQCDPLDRLDYYIDAVSVTEVKTENNKSAIPIYATCYDPTPNPSQNLAAIQSVKYFFETNKSDLSSSDKINLDALGLKMKNAPETTFEISGNTDNKGSNHIELSAQRAKTVANYLIEKHKIAAFRLLITANGANIANATNTTEDGRTENRRVDIIQSELTIAQCAYRKVIEYASKEQTDSAFILFNIWQRTTERYNLIIANFDPRLALLQKDTKRWQRYIESTKKAYKDKFETFSTFSFQLDSLYFADQKYRTVIADLENIIGKRNAKDTLPDDFWKVEERSKYTEDAARYVFLENLITKNGFPKRKQVGNRQSRAAFYIIQHQTEVKKSEKYLPILEKYAKEGDAEWSSFAMLYDRIKVDNNRPQRYGTQFRKKDFKLFPLENKATTNDFRAAIGLSKIDETTLKEAATTF
jgi:outer membrane protein OmpA-like peptidoglycan-associated protein